MLSGDHKSKQNSSKRRTIPKSFILKPIALAATRMMAERKEVWVEKQKKGG